MKGRKKNAIKNGEFAKRIQTKRKKNNKTKQNNKLTYKHIHTINITIIRILIDVFET